MARYCLDSHLEDACILAKPVALCTRLEISNWRVKMGGIGVMELAILAGIPLLLLVVGFVVLIAVRGSNK